MTTHVQLKAFETLSSEFLREHGAALHPWFDTPFGPQGSQGINWKIRNAVMVGVPGFEKIARLMKQTVKDWIGTRPSCRWCSNATSAFSSKST